MRTNALALVGILVAAPFALGGVHHGNAPVRAGAAATGAPASDLPPLLDPSKDSPGLKVGDKAPDVALRSADGATVKLADLYAKGPVVVTFYRGGWCPFCNKALSQWAGRMDDLEAAGGTFVAISPETAEHAKKTIEKSKMDEMVLVDTQGEAMRRFRVGFELTPETQKKYKGYGFDLETWNAFGRWELPAPATFVVDRDGTITWVFADWDYKKRADPDEVIAAVKEAK